MAFECVARYLCDHCGSSKQVEYRADQQYPKAPEGWLCVWIQRLPSPQVGGILCSPACALYWVKRKTESDDRLLRTVVEAQS